MFHEQFRTKERKVIGGILGVVLIILAWIIISAVSDSERYTEKAVMAENYLNAGNYENAVIAYKEALAMKGSDEELLTMGLADAYVGLEDYKQALEVLRACYQKKSTVKLKDKIEEVKTAEADYELTQSISRGDVYFSNQEYNKAIAEYEEAKRIKRKDVLPYQKITQAYIMQQQYELAQEEVMEGINATGKEELYGLLNGIDYYIQKGQYEEIIKQAKEYIYQENYKDGIATYQKAIQLMPKEAAAYRALAQFYIDQGDYESAVALLQEASLLSEDDALKGLLDTAQEKYQAVKERRVLLSQLKGALEKRDFTTLLTLLHTEYFKDNIASEVPIYYGSREGDVTGGIGLIIYGADTVYYGDIKGNLKQGEGIYFTHTSDQKEKGYYYYEGTWYNDIPDGKGKTVEASQQEAASGETHEQEIVTEGVFYQALEDGSMKKSFLQDGELVEWVQYRAYNGIPLKMGKTRISEPTPAANAYGIGELYRDKKKTGEIYKAEPNSIWGVKPFINRKEPVSD